jgi:hypothetical protein
LRSENSAAEDGELPAERVPSSAAHVEVDVSFIAAARVARSRAATILRQSR